MRLEYTWGRSSKFYEVEVAGCELICSYGKIGGKVRTIRRRCSAEVYAWRAGQRKIAEKVAKGYQVKTGTPCDIPSLMHGEKWRGDIDLSGWLVSEKYDGCRLYWDGERLWSKLGNVIHAPAWFIEGLPNEPLDCELWAGRGNLEIAHSAMRGNAASWRKCKLVAFDAPSDEPFCERAATLAALVANAPCAMCATYTVVHSNYDVVSMLGTMVAEGAEGLVGRDPMGGYQVGRHSSVMKIKQHYLS